MNKPFSQLSQRLLSLSLSGVITLALLGGISDLFLGEESAALLVQQQSASAPRA